MSNTNIVETGNVLFALCTYYDCKMHQYVVRLRLLNPIRGCLFVTKNSEILLYSGLGFRYNVSHISKSYCSEHNQGHPNVSRFITEYLGKI